MSQININSPDPREPVAVDSGGDRTAAAGINLITVLVVLVALAILAWFLFTGPLRSVVGGGGATNVNVNPPAQQAPNINVNPNVNVNPTAGSSSKP